MSEPTIYDETPEGDSLKLTPKAKYSIDFTERKNIRVAAYCRVSTDRKEQESSLSIQREHYTTYIKKQENWIFADIYADEGISGTSMKGREAFGRMMADAKAGKFDLIITKSASRFARNLLGGLEAIRELLRLNPPVGVLFEDINLNTLRPDSELYISLMLSMAQGESERKSMSIRMAYKWRCDKNIFLTPVDSLLGYTKNEQKKLVIEPEEAKTVKAIFAMFLHGEKVSSIAYRLTASRKKTGKDNTIWAPGSVINILRNERYCGDIVAQKTVTTDVLEHKSEKNHGREPLYYFENHHEGIVTREEYVRALILLRSNTGSVYYNPHYEVEMIREGLFVGFIPLNFAFGGYTAEHYLGATSRGKAEAGHYSSCITAAAGYRLIRPQEIEHSRAAQLTLSPKGLTFNTDCLSRFPNTKYVEIMLHPAERLIGVRPAKKTNRNAVEWKAKTISSAALCPMLFDLMGWNGSWKYKIMADCFVREKERALMFNLSEPEYQFSEDVKENEEITKRIRKTLQPGKWRDEIGGDFLSQMMASRRAYACSLDEWKTQSPALAVEGFPGNPVKRTGQELKTYLLTIGVQYE